MQGSPYPRCYYRCTFQGCAVKKAVERHPAGGHVSSTIYKVSAARKSAPCNALIVGRVWAYLDVYGRLSCEASGCQARVYAS